MEINTLPTFEEVDPSAVILSVENVEEGQTETQEESQEEIEETQEESSTEETSTSEDPLARAAYEAYVERGFIEEDDKFDGTFESLDEKLDNLPNILLKQAIEDLPQHSQSVLKFIAAAGSNLNLDELKGFMKEYIGEQDLPDVSTNDSARTYLEQHLKSQGLRPNAIQAQLDDLEDSDELVSEATKLLTSKEKKTDQLIQDKEKENEQFAQDQKAFVQSVNTTLTELGWSKSQQQKVLQTIPKTNDILGQVVKNPKAYVQLIDILSKFDGKEFDLEDILKKGESRANSSIREKITKSGFTSASGKTVATEDQPVPDLFKKGYKPVV